MFKARFPFLAVLSLVGLLGLQSPTALGQQPLTIAHAVSPSGITLLTISGTGSACYQIDQTNVTIAQNVITLHTQSHGVLCIPLTPDFISVPVDVGHLPAGHYSVVWIFDPPLDWLSPPILIQFNSVGAIDPIPTLNPGALLLLLAALGVLGLFSLRRRNAR